MADTLAKRDAIPWRPKIFSCLAGSLVLLIGILVLLGWLFTIQHFKSVYGEITMKANTALTLILAGLALLGISSDYRYLRLVGQIGALAVLLVGLLTLSEHLIGWNLHIDQLFFSEEAGALATTSAGRMGITASSCFVMFGVSMHLLYQRKMVSLAQTLAIIAGLWALLAIIGYAYQAEQLFAIARYTGIALHTAAALLLLSLGILASSSSEGWLSTIFEDSPAGTMTRRLTLVAFVAPFALAWLRLAGQRAGYFDLGLGTALLVVTITAIFLVAVWQTTGRLKQAERQRLTTDAIASDTKERLRRQAALVELSLEPILVWTVQDSIIEWNEGCERLYGYTKQEALGKVSHQLLKTEFPTSLEQHLKDLQRHGFWSGELNHTTKDGRTVMVESRQQIIHSDGAQVVLETNRDISARRDAERNLVQQRELLEVTLSSIGDGVIATDHSGNITFLNSVAQSLTGWGPDALGQPLQNVVRVLNEQTQEELENPALQAMKEDHAVGLANAGHTILVRKDGTSIPIDDSGAPIKGADGNTLGAVLIFRDVSERRKAERSQALLADIVESSDDAIVSKSLDGIIQSWNAGAERIFEYQANEIIGKSITVIIPPDRLQEEQTILEKVRRGERIEHFETVRVTKSGKPVPISLTVSPVRNRSGEIIGASKIARDITPQKRIEHYREELLIRERQLRKEAQVSNRLKDEFLTTISHELRTPLNAILGWATLLKRGVGENITSKGVEAIERSAKSQAQLIEDLLDVSRIISGKLRLDMKPVAVTAVVEAAMDSVRPAADAKQIELRMTIDPSVSRLNADEARLHQIMWNLLSNSIKFTSREGRVLIKVDRVDSQAEISVIDTGEGIPKEFLPFVFDRFQQFDGSTTRKHGGLGLGLAITRHLVEMHGGTIGVESEGQGRGSTFKIRLPIPAVISKEIKRSNQQAPAVAGPDLAGVKVLAIDDAEDSREMLKNVLEEFGAVVMTAPSAQEGLAVMTVWKPDVLVCDIGMPEEDGYSFIRKLRMLEPGAGGTTPAIALTGYVRVEDRLRALDAGFEMFVPKPIEVTELIALVDALSAARKT